MHADGNEEPGKTGNSSEEPEGRAEEYKKIRSQAQAALKRSQLARKQVSC